MLYIFGGLPGTGKTTLSMRLAQDLGALHVRIDTIEQALRDSGVRIEGGEGYVVGYRVAKDNLRLGRDVVVDSVNPWAVTRYEWRETARGQGTTFVEIEVVCSDRSEHRRRVESRSNDIPGLTLPTWNDVLNREYHPWEEDHIVIDTAGQTPRQSVAALHWVIKSMGIGV